MRFGIVALAAAALLLVGCVPQPDATPTPSATALPFATDDEAFAAAEATYRAYVDALNQVDLQDPDTFEPVYAWLGGQMLASERRLLSQMHADDWAISGNSKVERAWPITTGEISTIGICLQVSDVRVVDRDGKSVVGSSRPDTQEMQVTVVSSRSSPTGLVIDDISGLEAAGECTS
ncbi:MAG: hypothetical protein DI573_10030 [Microbacterium sp.]|uniref:hypothetical protein n=1 Tax=Microbacterium sp. TaxID=51671 RepID=UPI000DB02A21|nr:hypothetical protein [Microbacterium sp.]PZU38309.1 MAG: hypothetical protein DI573_10030 [Microbacterium sp.]